MEENNMNTLHFSVIINAPKEKVWNKMLSDDSYRVWTEAFMPGSHYVGDWSKGSKILFLAPNEQGSLSGMVSRIKENKPFEFLSIEHLGEVQDGNEVAAPSEWAGAHENYTFREVNGSTEVLVDLDMEQESEFAEMFKDMWPKALQKLKNISEN
jgi:hypothetical protein